MVKTKELIICIISIIALVLTITTDAFATDSIQDLNSLLGNNTNNEQNNEFQEIGGSVNNKINNTVKNTTNTNVRNNTNNTTNAMPNTGVSYSSMIIIAICAISAVYAYKKIRDYNV